VPTAIRSAIALVLVHLAVATIHGLAHAADSVLPGPRDLAFILVVIYACPLVAAILLWRQRQAGALVLALSMAGALCYGLAGHFLLSGADNVAQQAAGAWPIIFQVTAVLLVPLETLGCVFGVRLIVIAQHMRAPHQA